MSLHTDHIFVVMRARGLKKGKKKEYSYVPKRHEGFLTNGVLMGLYLGMEVNVSIETISCCLLIQRSLSKIIHSD